MSSQRCQSRPVYHFSDGTASLKDRTTLHDIAGALGVTTATVSHALNGLPGVSSETRVRILEVARQLHYRPNLAARYLASNRRFRVSVNTLQGTENFEEELRDGIATEARSFAFQNIDLDFRTYSGVGDEEERAFEAALTDEVDGIVVLATNTKRLRRSIRHAVRCEIPVVCVVNEIPKSGRLAAVSVDARVTGSLAADLMGKLVGGSGEVAINLSDRAGPDAEVFAAFEGALRSLHPKLRLETIIEDHDIESEAYDKCCQLLRVRKQLAGIYVAARTSRPALEALQDSSMLSHTTVITNDLSRDLVEEMRSGAVAAIIHQRPRMQGRAAVRLLYDFLIDGRPPRSNLTLHPHLLMNGNLDAYLQSLLGETMM